MLPDTLLPLNENTLPHMTAIMQNLMHASVQNMLSANRHKDGAKALALLMRNPNTPLHCICLSHLINPPDFVAPIKGDESMSDSGEFLRKIPLSDQKTIKDIYQRINHLISAKSTLLSFNYIEVNAIVSKQLADIDSELDALKRYLSQCLRPGGHIRNFPDDERKAYQRISIAIKRFLHKNKAEHPEAVAYITKHLKMGLYFQYLEG